MLWRLIQFLPKKKVTPQGCSSPSQRPPQLLAPHASPSRCCPHGPGEDPLAPRLQDQRRCSSFWGLPLKAAESPRHRLEMPMGQRKGMGRGEGVISGSCQPWMWPVTDGRHRRHGAGSALYLLSHSPDPWSPKCPEHSADGEPQPGTAAQGKARRGRPLRWPQLQDILREGLGGSRRRQTQESWSSAGASSADVSPARVPAAGTRPRARPPWGEGKQLGCSGAKLVATQGTRRPSSTRRAGLNHQNPQTQLGQSTGEAEQSCAGLRLTALSQKHHNAKLISDRADERCYLSVQSTDCFNCYYYRC